MSSNRKRVPRESQETYTLLEEMAASTVHPLPQASRTFHLRGMRASLDAMRADAKPMRAHWQVLADMVNILETLVEMGELDDAGGWIAESTNELAVSAKRHAGEGKPLRLTGPGLVAVGNAFDGFELAINSLPARTMVRAHRRTEKRIADMRAGRSRKHDVELVSL